MGLECISRRTRQGSCRDYSIAATAADVVGDRDRLHSSTHSPVAGACGYWKRAHPLAFTAGCPGPRARRGWARWARWTSDCGS